MRPGTAKITSIVLILLLLFVGIRYLLPFSLPFLLGAGLALAAEPGVRFLTGKLHMPRAAAAGISVSAVFTLICILVLLLVSVLFRELGLLAGILPDMERMAMDGLEALKGWLLSLSGKCPESLRPMLTRNVTELFSGGSALLDRITHCALGLAGALLTALPDSALALGTALISAFLISARLPRIRKQFSRRFQGPGARLLQDVLHRLRATAGLWLLAQLKLSAVTCILLILGFILLRIPFAPVWALAVALVDAFPILGTGTVLLPWSVVCLLQHDGARALGLLGIYIVVSLTRSILEPRFIGRQLGLDPLVTLIAMYLGFRLWGMPGMVLAPVLVISVAGLLPEAGLEA